MLGDGFQSFFNTFGSFKIFTISGPQDPSIITKIFLKYTKTSNHFKKILLLHISTFGESKILKMERAGHQGCFIKKRKLFLWVQNNWC